MHPILLYLAATLFAVASSALPVDTEGEVTDVTEVNSPEYAYVQHYNENMDMDMDMPKTKNISLDLHHETPYDEEISHNRRIRDIPLDPLQTLQNLVKSVYTELISFVNETRFQNDRFASRMENLRERVTNLGVQVAHFTPANAVLAHQFAFTQHFFHVLRISNENMNLLSLVNDRYHRLLYNTSELRASVMALMTAQGNPNTAYPNFSQVVSRLTSRRHSLETEFRSIPNLPLSLRMMIWDHLIRTDEVVQHLQRSVPRHCEL